MSTPLHFYHIGAMGDWGLLESILTEHFTLLDEAEFPGDYFFGVIGPEENRKRVIDWLDERGEICAEADEGYEHITLDCLQKLCKNGLNPDVPILYTHTKGTFNISEFNTRWRQAMDELLIRYWRQRLEELKTNDAVGPHWITQEAYPNAPVNPSFFGGNFWWANAGHIAGLPELNWSIRHGAEGWVGWNIPRVLDLKPGWPVY
jgi:hypothetical protein